MFKIEGKYGNIQIDGRSIDIEKIEEKELSQHLKKLEKKQMELIQQQNEYLSQIIEEKESKNEGEKGNKRDC